jgi:hypothetical protein
MTNSSTRNEPRSDKKPIAIADGADIHAAVDHPRKDIVVDGRGDDDDHDISRSAGEAHHAQVEPEDLDHQGRPLPDWTRRYPESERGFLSWAGDDPDETPRAHELNLRLIEVGQTFDKGARGIPRGSLDNSVVRSMFKSTVGMTAFRVGVSNVPHQNTDEEVFAALGGKPLPAAPPPSSARSDAEVEVQPDWLSMYPAEYARLLAEHGVPTVRGSQVDAFNRRLTELVSPDCVDPAALEKAAGRALFYAFGGNPYAVDYVPDDVVAECERDAELHDHASTQLDLEDVCWERYPEEFRPTLQWLGRPDYEHPGAAAFNRALIAASNYLRDGGGPLDVAALEQFRRYLWRAFFGDESCPT